MEQFLAAFQNQLIRQGGSEGMRLREFWALINSIYMEIFGESLDTDHFRKHLWQEYILKRPHIFGIKGRDQNNKNDPAFRYDNENAFIYVQEKIRLEHYTLGTACKINECGIKILDLVAAQGAATQSDLAKALDLDPRSLFHQLKPLLSIGILEKAPVSYKKTFTQLLFLGRDRDFVHSENFKAEGIQFNMVDVKAKILQLLKSAPSRSLYTMQIYEILGKSDGDGTKNVKFYQRNINTLITKGNVRVVEGVVPSEIGANVRMIQWVSDYGNEVDEEDINESAQIGFDLLHWGAPLEMQIYTFICQNSPRGIILSDVMNHFGLHRKASYRVSERLSSGGKYIIGSEGVEKKPEFHGKERRHRLISTSSTHSQISSPNSLTETSQSPKIKRDSVTRRARIDALLALLEENCFFEVGKGLINLLQTHLKEETFLMDTKTLKRMIKDLENEGKLKIYTISSPGDTSRSIIIRNDLDIDHEIVQNYVKGLSQKPFVDLEKDNDQDVLCDNDIAPASIPSLSKERPASTSLSKVKMQKYGHLFGIMQKCKVLHRYLLKRSLDDDEDPKFCFETVPVLFKSLPLVLFLQIVGIGETSNGLAAYLQTNLKSSISLCSLPSNIKREIYRRRIDRHKSVMKKCLEILVDLGLLEADQTFPEISHKLAFQYKIHGHSANSIGATVDFTRDDWEDAFDEYWNSLHRMLTSLECKNDLGHSLLIAANSHNWKFTSPYDRTFKKRLFQILNHVQDTEEERKIKIENLAGDFELTREEVEIALDEYCIERERRKRERNSEKKRKREEKRKQRKSASPREQDENDAESEEEAITFANPENVKDIYLGYLILRDSSDSGLIPWSHLCELTKSGSGEEYRGLVFRIENSWKEREWIDSLRWKFSFLKTCIEAGKFGDIKWESWAEQFEWYKAKVQEEPFISFDYGKDDKSLSTFIVENDLLQDSINWKRMNKLQQFWHFKLESFSFPENNSPCYSIADKEECVKEHLLRKFIAHPKAQSLDFTGIETLIQKMIDSKLLSKSTKNREYQRRIPGGELFVHENFVNLVESEERGAFCLRCFEFCHGRLDDDAPSNYKSQDWRLLEANTDITLSQFINLSTKIEWTNNEAKIFFKKNANKHVFTEAPESQNCLWECAPNYYQNCLAIIVAYLKTQPIVDMKTMVDSLAFSFITRNEVVACVQKLHNEGLIGGRLDQEFYLESV